MRTSTTGSSARRCMARLAIWWVLHTSFTANAFQFCPSQSKRQITFERYVAASASSLADFAGSSSSHNNKNTNTNITGAATELISEFLLTDDHDDDQELVDRKKQALLANSRSKSSSFRVTLPLSSPLGMTVCEVGPRRAFNYDRQMDLDTMQISSERPITANADVSVLTPHDIQARVADMDVHFRGVLITAVDRESEAWKQNVRPGDVLHAISATLGDAMWPKSTLEGVRSALTSRRMTSSVVDFQLTRPRVVAGVDISDTKAGNQYELTLTRPIGLLLRETVDGRVQVMGFSEIAPKLVQYAVKVGDYVVAVDSSMGDRLWPVSTVEGVISACTSRLPGQSITMRFERPEQVAVSADNSGIMDPTSVVATASALKSSATIATATSTADTNKKQLLSRCRDVLKRYVKEEENNMLFVQSKFRGKYALPAIVADKVVDALATAEASVDCVTLSMIMDAYLSCRQPDRALQVFEAATGFAADASIQSSRHTTIQGRDGTTLQPNDAALNLVTGTTLLKAHAMRGDVHAIARVLAALEGRSGTVIGGLETAPWPWTGTFGSIQLDTKCYNIAMSAFEVIGGDIALQHALEVFNRLSDPNALGSNGPAKDVVSYNTMISMLSNEGRSQEAFALFDRMKRSGSSALRPDKYTYTSLIKAVSNQDDIQELFYDMRERGVEPDCVTYNTMIKSLCESKRWTQATRLITDMESRGVVPDSMTYGYLMNAMLKTGKPNACLALFESATVSPKTSALTENIYLYTTAITAASMLGDYERALELVSRMTAVGIRPNVKTLTAVMGACLSSGRADLAAQLFQRMEHPDGYAMAQGIQAQCASGDVESALKLLQQQQRGVKAIMTGKDLMRSYHAVIQASLERRDFDTARTALKDLFSKGYIPSQSIVLSVTEMLRPPVDLVGKDDASANVLDQQRFSFGLYLIDSMVARKLDIDGRLYTSLLAFATRHGGLTRKVATFMMQSKTSVGNSNTAKQLLSLGDNGQEQENEPPVVTTITKWEDLFLNYDLYKEALKDMNADSNRVSLPPLPVRVSSRDVPRVLRAEQFVTSRKASSSSSSSFASSTSSRQQSKDSSSFSRRRSSTMARSRSS